MRTPTLVFTEMHCMQSKYENLKLVQTGSGTLGINDQTGIENSEEEKPTNQPTNQHTHTHTHTHTYTHTHTNKQQPSRNIQHFVNFFTSRTRWSGSFYQISYQRSLLSWCARYEYRILRKAHLLRARRGKKTMAPLGGSENLFTNLLSRTCQLNR